MSTFTFSGNTVECFRDFLGRYHWDGIQAFLADFCRVHKATVRRWRNGKLPLGDELLRLRVLLDLAGGYHVTEFSDQPGIVRQFGQAIALGLIEPKEAQELLGYKNVQGLYDMLLRGQEPLRHRWYRLERYVENSTEELESAVAEFRRKLEALPKETGYVPAKRPSPVSPHEASIQPDVGSTDPLVAALVNALRCTSSLTSAVFGSSGQEATLRRLHGIINEQEMVSILDHIDRLKVRRD